MAEPSEYLMHPTLGTLGWLPKFSHWFTQLQRPSGGLLDLIVQPWDEDRFGFLQRAAELFRWAMVHERRALAEAMQAELLELYNEVWREPDEPQLSAEELTDRLDWQLLKLCESEIVPVEFSYEAGDLFGYHGVTVGLDEELRFRSVDLRG